MDIEKFFQVFGAVIPLAMVAGALYYISTWAHAASSAAQVVHP